MMNKFESHNMLMIYHSILLYGDHSFQLGNPERLNKVDGFYYMCCGVNDNTYTQVTNVYSNICPYRLLNNAL